MQRRDPGLTDLLSASPAYAIFPDIGAGGALVAGGAFGRGILYENGRATGYVELKQGSVGPQLGGQTYAELVVLRDRSDVDRLKGGAFDVGVGMSVVALKAGAAAEAQARGNTTVIVMPRGGLMAGVAVKGQKIEYRPLAPLRG